MKQDIIQSLTSFLTDVSIHYQKKDNIIHFPFYIEGKINEGATFIHVSEESYIVETGLPIEVHPEAFDLLTEFFIKINEKSEYGYFQLNEETHLISYIIKVNVHNTSLPRKVIEHSLLLPIEIYGAYGFANAIYYLLSNILTVDEALDFVRRDR
jgi:hypothetical protein